jgi:hypothetical protein
MYYYWRKYDHVNFFQLATILAKVLKYNRNLFWSIVTEIPQREYNSAVEKITQHIFAKNGLLNTLNSCGNQKGHIRRHALAVLSFNHRLAQSSPIQI